MRRSFRAQDVIAVLAGLIGQRGVPAHLRSDNGPEFVAKVVQAWLKGNAIGALYRGGSPWENAYVESFNTLLRDEHLNREEFASLLDMEVLAAGWRRDYNEARPHSSLDNLAPAVFAARWRASRGYAPPCACQRGKPESMNQNSHINWINTWGLANNYQTTFARHRLYFAPDPRFFPAFLTKTYLSPYFKRCCAVSPKRTFMSPVCIDRKLSIV